MPLDRHSREVVKLASTQAVLRIGAVSRLHGQTRRARIRDSKPTRRRARPSRSILSDPVGRRRRSRCSVYVGFRSLLTDDRTPQDYLAEMRNGGSDRRWPAAYELSRLMADPKVRADRTLAPALVKAFEAAKDDDPRVRRYLALAIGRLDPPMPPEAVAGPDQGARRSPDGETRDQRHLGARLVGRSGGRADASAALRVAGRRRHPQDGGLRARRAAGRRAARDAAHGARRTRRPTCAGTRRSRWRATAATTASPVLRQMLDRAYVEQAVKRDGAAGRGSRSDCRRDDQRPARGGDAQGRVRSSRSVTTLSQQDRSMKVRQAALEALKVMWIRGRHG